MAMMMMIIMLMMIAFVNIAMSKITLHNITFTSWCSWIWLPSSGSLLLAPYNSFRPLSGRWFLDFFCWIYILPKVSCAGYAVCVPIVWVRESLTHWGTWKLNWPLPLHSLPLSRVGQLLNSLARMTHLQVHQSTRWHAWNQQQLKAQG